MTWVRSRDWESITRILIFAKKFRQDLSRRARVCGSGKFRGSVTPSRDFDRRREPR